MDPLVQTVLLALASTLAGFLGALTGLGGGVVLIPVLVLAFGVDMRYAIGTSLVAVIATSSGAAAAYVRDGYTNVRVAILLEVATVVGALAGALLAARLATPALGVLFALVLLWSAVQTLRPPRPRALDSAPDALAQRLRLDSSYPARESPAREGPTRESMVAYRVHRVPLALVIMLGAGVLSALVGIGSGIVKVLAMDRAMGLPFKVSTTTSNFMIGVTAAASAGVYLSRGQIVPQLAAPVALGALAGSLLGARVLPRINTKALRLVFAICVVVAGVEILLRAAGGRL